MEKAKKIYGIYIFKTYTNLLWPSIYFDKVVEEESDSGSEEDLEEMEYFFGDYEEYEDLELTNPQTDAEYLAKRAVLDKEALEIRENRRLLDLASTTNTITSTQMEDSSSSATTTTTTCTSATSTQIEDSSSSATTTTTSCTSASSTQIEDNASSEEEQNYTPLKKRKCD